MDRGLAGRDGEELAAAAEGRPGCDEDGHPEAATVSGPSEETENLQMGSDDVLKITEKRAVSYRVTHKTSFSNVVASHKRVSANGYVACGNGFMQSCLEICLLMHPLRLPCSHVLHSIPMHCAQ